MLAQDSWSLSSTCMWTMAFCTVHFNIKVWKTIHEEDKKFFVMWWKTTKGRCLYPHGRGHQQCLARWLASARRTIKKEAWVQRSWRCTGTLAMARSTASRVVLEFAFGVSVLAQHNTNKVGQIKVHHATMLFRSRTTMRRSCP